VTSAPESGLRELAAKHAIENALSMHSRGVDRADYNLLASAYHDDATVDYGFFSGAARQLAEILAGAQKGQPVTMHRTSNMWIAVDGDEARSKATSSRRSSRRILPVRSGAWWVAVISTATRAVPVPGVSRIAST
jgi:hypothetical protein